MRTELALLVVVCLAATACRGGGAPAVPVTPPPTQVLLIPAATATPRVLRTPVALTPTPAALGGRPDCPADWAAYNDPDARFSLCYPATLSAISERFSLRGTAVQIEPPDFATSRPEDRVFLLASWRPSSYLQGPGPASLCAVFAQAGEASRQEGRMTLGEAEAPTCLTEVHQIVPGVGVTDQIDYYQLIVEIPHLSGGFLVIRTTYSGPDFDASRGTIMRMLATLALEE